MFKIGDLVTSKVHPNLYGIIIGTFQNRIDTPTFYTIEWLHNGFTYFHIDKELIKVS
jgi:hypothetical protein